MERSLSLGRRTVMVLIASGLVASTAGLALADGAASAHTISGNVVYRERMLLPPGAIATVRLEDVSLADAPARVLAETSVPAHTSPTAFSLDYDPGLIEAGHTYALRAGITDSDQLMFTTTERHTFDPHQAGAVELLVQRVANEAAATLPLVGGWLAEDIDGTGVIDNLQTTLDIAADGAVSGSGGCNRFSGSAKIAGDSIVFGDLAATMMACTDAAMNQEHKFHAALGAARSFSIDAERRKLYLSDASGKVVVQFSAI